MEFWHLLVLLHTILMTIGLYLSKIFVHRIHPYQILFYQYVASVITISLYVHTLKPEAKFGDISWWFLGIGVLFAFGISASYHAKKQSLSKTITAKKLDNFLAILLAILFLGEWHLLSLAHIDGVKRIIGLICSLVAVMLLYNKKVHTGSEKTFNFKIWIKWISAVIIIQGLAKFIATFAVNLNEPLQVLQLQYIGSLLAITFLCWYTDKKLSVGTKNVLGALAIGVLISSSLATLYSALATSSATQVFAITSLLTVITATAIGMLFFKEKITKKLILPYLIMFIAIYLLK